uniref:Setae polypeptide n=1 Tax=Ochrogaster lunifer TaxID=319761 RepID=A0AA49IK78_OCHLU|nr:setae polypeptide [Ochrogaster lunifer]
MIKLFLLLTAAICGGMAYLFDEPPPSYTRTPLGDAIDKSTMKVLKTAYELATDKNVVSSPLGLMLLLSLYNSGAVGSSKEEIDQFLGGQNLKQLSESYMSLSHEFSNMDPEYLTLANKVYVSNQYSPTDQFLAAAISYRSEVDTLDFAKPADAAAIINKWASEKTKGHITQPVSKDSLDPVTAAALFNVIFFQGHWHVPFNASNTKDKDFHVNSKTTLKKPMMHLLQSLYYTESKDLGARMIELPYKEKGFRMVVVLPNKVDGLPTVLQKASEKGLLSDVFSLSPAGADVDLDMPKFDIRSKLDFKRILPEVGVSKIFEEPALGIVKGQPVKVSEAFQEAFIKVDEEGATAGAFTGLVAVPMSSRPKLPKPIKFKVNHPFAYVILYEDKVLFAGTLTK